MGIPSSQEPAARTPTSPKSKGPEAREKDKGDGGASGLPKFVLGYLAGSFVASTVSSCSAKKKEGERVQDQSGDPPSYVPAPPLSVSGPQFTGLAEAIAALKSGRVSQTVEERYSLDGDASVFIFHEANNEPVMLLRVRDEGERTALIREIQAAKLPMRAVLSQTSTSVAVAAEPAAPKTAPWYDPFIWPATIMMGGGLALWWLSTRVERMGKWIQEMESPKEASYLNRFEEKPTERFADVGGNRTLVKELQYLVDDIKLVQSGRTEIRLPRGVMLVGPTGTGKTFGARVVAGEADCLLFYLNAGDLRSSSFMGAWTRAANTLFDTVRKKIAAETKRLRGLPDANGKEEAVAIVILDEFDAAGKSRDAQGSNDEADALVNAILAKMDGPDAHKYRNIVVFAMTNRVDVIDPALLRPGRFSVQIQVLPPETVEERLDILQKVLKKIEERESRELASPEALADLAKLTPGLGGDHLRGILQKAFDLARRNGQETVDYRTVLEAYQQVQFGPVNEAQERSVRHDIVRAHENGHGLMGYFLDLMPIIVSFRPRGNSLGRVVSDIAELREPPQTRQDVLKALLHAAGGRAGELLHLGVAGASNGVLGGDFKAIGDLARQFLSSGMTDGTYHTPLDGHDEALLPERYRKAIERLGAWAVRTGVKCFKSLKPETIARISEDSATLADELVGAEAAHFYRDRLSAEEVADAKAIIAGAMEELATVLSDSHADRGRRPRRKHPLRPPADPDPEASRSAQHLTT